MTTNAPPSESTVQAFANMSAALTGFQSSFIRPFLDPVNLSGIFYEYVVAQVGQTMMDALMSAFAALSSQTPSLTPQQIADTQARRRYAMQILDWREVRRI